MGLERGPLDLDFVANMADDGLQNATVPLSFKKAMDMLSKDQAKDLVRTINKFMKEFQRRPPDAVIDSQTMQEFFVQMESTVHKHPLFQGAQMADIEEFMEAVERYLLIKLYDRTFGKCQEDLERDDLLSNRMLALQFVRPEHLEISPKLVADSFDASLQLAEKALVNMKLYKAPRDKLVCILNCCRVINNLLSSLLTGDVAGADDFTPILIYTVIRAQPQHLASNLAFIERYRMQSRLVSEAQYYFIQLSSAAAFIETLNANSLKVEHDEFIAHMLQHGAMTEEELLMGTSSPRRTASAPAQQAQQLSTAVPSSITERVPTSIEANQVRASTDTLPPLPTPSQSPIVTPNPRREDPTPPTIPPFILPKTLAELENEGVKLLLAEEASGNLHKKYKFLYTAVDDLMMGDVQVLLSDYKELALKYEMLRLAVDYQASGASRQLQPSLPQPTTGPASLPAGVQASQLLDLWSVADDTAPVLMTATPAIAPSQMSASSATNTAGVTPTQTLASPSPKTLPTPPTAPTSAPSSSEHTKEGVLNLGDLLGPSVEGGEGTQDVKLSPMLASASAAAELVDVQRGSRRTGDESTNHPSSTPSDTADASNFAAPNSARSSTTDLMANLPGSPPVGLRRPEPVAATDESPAASRLTSGLPQPVMDLLS